MTIDRKIFSLILCDIAASISHGNPRSAQVVLANISGLIPASNEHDNGYDLMIPDKDSSGVYHGLRYINLPHSEVTSH